MRRLTLILSDLYVPAEAVKESFPATLQLPSLEWLLRFAAPTKHIEGWRQWLAQELGAGELAGLPVTHLISFDDAAPKKGLWLATPVSLEARLDHVRLRDRGLLRLPPEQGAALCAEFEHTFGPDHLLRVGEGSQLLLEGGPVADIRTIDPARLLDSDIGHALPSGSSAAGELRRLGAEIEMWLPGTQVNAARERAGQRTISALWLWGGGVVKPLTPGARLQQPVRIFGGDAGLVALASRVSAEAARQPPESFAALDPHADAYVEFAPMSGDSRESLAELESQWFAPARAALSAGALDRLSVVANDRVFEVTRRAGWKFWRARRGWLESLGRGARAKA